MDVTFWQHFDLPFKGTPCNEFNNFTFCVRFRYILSWCIKTEVMLTFPFHFYDLFAVSFECLVRKSLNLSFRYSLQVYCPVGNRVGESTKDRSNLSKIISFRQYDANLSIRLYIIFVALSVKSGRFLPHQPFKHIRGPWHRYRII